LKKIVRDLANCFSNSIEFHLGLLIPNTRKPAIKLTHNPTKIHLDLSFSDVLGAIHTDILDHLMNLQGREARGQKASPIRQKVVLVVAAGKTLP
jgi:hypothetical protein